MVSVYPLASLVLGRMRRKKQLRVPVAHLPHRLRGPLALGAPGHRPSPRRQRDLGRGRHLTRRQRRPRARPARQRPLPRRRPTTATRCAPTSASRPKTARCWWSRARGAWATSSPPSRRSAAAASSTRSPCAAATTTCAPSSSSGGYGTVIGWTDEMPALMTAADALVENAGGLTCMEAFAVGLPVITFKPIAGHGKDNAEMMARAGRQLLRPRRRRAARDARARSRAPGPERDALVDTARRLFVADPADDVEELAADRPPRRPQGPGGRAAYAARTSHRDDRRRERARALRRAHARRAGGVGDRRRRGQAAEARRPHRVRRGAPRPRAAHRPRAARADPRHGRLGGRRRAGRHATARSSSRTSPTRASTSPTAAGARARSCAGTAPATTSTRRAR